MFLFRLPRKILVTLNSIDELIRLDHLSAWEIISVKKIIVQNK
jgi:hypothetical protein